MKLTLRDKIALWIHFTDSIGEGYGYFDSDFIDYKKTSCQDYIRWEKVTKEYNVCKHNYNTCIPPCNYLKHLDCEYFNVADRILELVKNDMPILQSQDRLEAQVVEAAMNCQDDHRHCSKTGQFSCGLVEAISALNMERKT